MATDKYLSNVMDPRNELVRRARSDLRSQKEKKIMRIFSVKGSTHDITDITTDVLYSCARYIR